MLPARASRQWVVDGRVFGTRRDQQSETKHNQTHGDLPRAGLRNWECFHHSQFNVISSGLPYQAMKNPENYRDLPLRVVSYCSYVVELTEEQQQHIMNPSERQDWQE
jgi:pyruvate-formate lyase